MKKKTFISRKSWAAVILTLFFILGGNPIRGHSRGDLEPYIQQELNRLEETFRLIERYGEKIWPEWDNYPDVEFQVLFPNSVSLIVNPSSDIPPGYIKEEGLLFRGREIYINRTQELPIPISPPLVGGGGGGMTINIKLKEADEIPVDISEMNADQKVSVCTDRQLLVYVHEYFHALQNKLWKSESPGRKIEITPEYASYKEIEGQALLNAYMEPDYQKAREYLQDFAVARLMKHHLMTEENITAEEWSSVAEGTASYAHTKMAMLIHQDPEHPESAVADDPYYFDFKYFDSLIRKEITAPLKDVLGDTHDQVEGPGYKYGMVQCHLLDRFFPDWKKGFFENKRNMHEVILDYLHLSDQEKMEIESRIKKTYGFDQLLAKHSRVLKERDDAVEMIESRQGIEYTIDVTKTQEFMRVEARGQDIRLGSKRIFPHGIEKATLGEIELTTIDTPCESSSPYIVRWVDTESPEKGKEYHLEYESEENGIYKNAVVKTRGFILKAPEIQIRKFGSKIKFKLLVKVPRS